MSMKKLTKNEREMLNTLRYLSRFNIGDDLEYRIKKTLCKVSGNHFKKTIPTTYSRYKICAKCYLTK